MKKLLIVISLLFPVSAFANQCVTEVPETVECELFEYPEYDGLFVDWAGVRKFCQDEGFTWGYHNWNVERISTPGTVYATSDSSDEWIIGVVTNAETSYTYKVLSVECTKPS